MNMKDLSLKPCYDADLTISRSQYGAGADPGFDQGGAPDRDWPKTAILGPQFCRILVLGPHFWWSGGARPPPWIRPCGGFSTSSLV